MSTTDAAKYKFIVKEGQVSVAGANDAPVMLTLEPTVGHLRVLGGGLLSLRLAAGTSYEQAQDLARTLNRLVADVAYNP